MPFPDDLRASVALQQAGIKIPPSPFYTSPQEHACLVQRRDNRAWTRVAECRRTGEWMASNLNEIWTEAYAAGALAALEKRT